MVWVGVPEVGIGQREELSCDAVAIKTSDDPSRELWSWIHSSALSQLEAKGLGFIPYIPYVNHWKRAVTGGEGGCDLGLNGSLKAVPREGLS